MRVKSIRTSAARFTAWLWRQVWRKRKHQLNNIAAINVTCAPARTLRSTLRLTDPLSKPPYMSKPATAARAATNTSTDITVPAPATALPKRTPKRNHSPGNVRLRRFQRRRSLSINPSFIPMITNKVLFWSHRLHIISAISNNDEFNTFFERIGVCRTMPEPMILCKFELRKTNLLISWQTSSSPPSEYAF